MSAFTLVSLEVLVLLALGLALARVLRAPTRADRLVAFDVVFACGAALCVLAALSVGRTVFLDVALGLALTGFVATLCWARVLALAERKEER